LCLQPRHYAPGEVVIRKDVLSSGVYLILSGHIHVSDAQAAGDAITASVKAEDTAVKIEESMKEESKGAGMDAAAVLAEAEAAEKFLEDVDESKVLVTLVSGAMMGEECLLPITLAMPAVAKAAEWLDLLYIDRRDIISLLTDNREALARVHLAARLRNERFRTLLDCTKFLQRRSKTNASSSANNQSFMSRSSRVVPPLKTGDGGECLGFRVGESCRHSRLAMAVSV
jgi:CRP-like cAMP-binding protein